MNTTSTATPNLISSQRSTTMSNRYYRRAPKLSTNLRKLLLNEKLRVAEFYAEAEVTAPTLGQLIIRDSERDDNYLNY